MPPGGGTAEDQQNMALILGWIAGADLSMSAAAHDDAELWADIDLQPTSAEVDEQTLSKD